MHILGILDRDSSNGFELNRDNRRNAELEHCGCCKNRKHPNFLGILPSINANGLSWNAAFRCVRLDVHSKISTNVEPKLFDSALVPNTPTNANDFACIHCGRR